MPCPADIAKCDSTVSFPMPTFNTVALCPACLVHCLGSVYIQSPSWNCLLLMKFMIPSMMLEKCDYFRVAECLSGMCARADVIADIIVDKEKLSVLHLWSDCGASCSILRTSGPSLQFGIGVEQDDCCALLRREARKR